MISAQWRILSTSICDSDKHCGLAGKPGDGTRIRGRRRVQRASKVHATTTVRYPVHADRRYWNETVIEISRPSWSLPPEPYEVVP